MRLFHTARSLMCDVMACACLARGSMDIDIAASLTFSSHSTITPSTCLFCCLHRKEMESTRASENRVEP